MLTNSASQFCSSNRYDSYEAAETEARRMISAGTGTVHILAFVVEIRRKVDVELVKADA